MERSEGMVWGLLFTIEREVHLRLVVMILLGYIILLKNNLTILYYFGVKIKRTKNGYEKSLSPNTCRQKWVK
jgi:hypothetical protein